MTESQKTPGFVTSKPVKVLNPRYAGATSETVGRARLHAAGIATRPGTHAVHMLGHYRKRYGIAPETYPVSRACDRDTLALPLHNAMSDDDHAYVIESIRAL